MTFPQLEAGYLRQLVESPRDDEPAGRHERKPGRSAARQGLRILVDRASFLGTSPRWVGETAAVNPAAIRTEIVSSGLVCRALSLCRVICAVDRLLKALVIVIAALLLAALLATQAQAHEGHDGSAGVSAPMIEAAASKDKATLSGDLSDAATDPAKCDGHCCFAGACCLGVAEPLPAALPHLGALDAKSERDADAIPSAAPEGPRRPPKRDI